MFNVRTRCELLEIVTVLVLVLCTITASDTSASPGNSKFLSNGRINQDMVAINIPGDVILGGLFPVHEKGEGTPCGPKVYNRGVHRLEAMLFAVDRVNRDVKILPDITLGVHILDTCSRDTYALNQSLQFVRRSLDSLDTSAFECGDHSVPRLKTNASGPVVGVIGGSYSSVSLQVANLLRLFHIPQISPASTAKALSDKSRFDLFARTVPPDTFQSIALVDIVKKFNWSYVSTIHSEGSYGEYGIEAFHKEATERNVCIAVAEKVPSSADERNFDSIITKLQKKPNARVVVLFTRAEDARRILQAAKRANLTQPFHWIASDGWGRQQKLVEGIEDIAEGAITVELQSGYIEEFDEYMMSRTPENNQRNPWFEEFWQDTFDCLLEHNFPLKFQNGENFRVCDPNYRLSEKIGYEQESKIQFVIDAVYAFAYALNNLHHDICVKPYQITSSAEGDSISGRNRIGLCPEMTNYDGKDFYNNYLLNVSFIDMVGSQVKFDSQGDGLARYDILNYQRLENSSGYYYKAIGKWFDKLELNLDNIVWNRESDIPSSACSLPCEAGMIKKQQGDTCCWICDNCEEYEYVYDEFTCRDCGPGYWPHPDKLGCYALDIQYMRWDSVYAIIPLAIACVGIVLTIIVIGLFVKHHDTPLIRASGRELSYLLLCGILVCFCNTFILLAQPTLLSCIAQRFGVGVGFSIIYGALLTKTNRISRIFDSASKSARRPKYISPQSQLVISITFIAVQVLITMIWMIVEPPGTRQHYPDRRQVQLKCKIQDMSFLFSQLYNMLLITICTVYAVKTRKIPENFNESKFIGFTMYTTCIIWLAFIPIYFGTGNSYEVQISTLCMSISLSASVALVCLYSPKVYILVWHPDKNVRKLTMNNAAYRRSGCGAAGGGASTGIGTAAKVAISTTDAVSDAGVGIGATSTSIAPAPATSSTSAIGVATVPPLSTASCSSGGGGETSSIIDNHESLRTNQGHCDDCNASAPASCEICVAKAQTIATAESAGTTTTAAVVTTMVVPTVESTDEIRLDGDDDEDDDEVESGEESAVAIERLSEQLVEMTECHGAGNTLKLRCIHQQQPKSTTSPPTLQSPTTPPCPAAQSGVVSQSSVDSVYRKRQPKHVTALL